MFSFLNTISPSLLLLALLTSPLMAKTSDLVITDAWVRAAPPTVSMHAAYATLKNTGGNSVTLTNITSQQFEHIMLHESSIEDGIARMRHVEVLTLKPGETVKLMPGGFHLMLMQANTDINIGDRINFVFYFSNSDSVEVTAPVKRAVKQQAEHKAHHHGD